MEAAGSSALAYEATRSCRRLLGQHEARARTTTRSKGSEQRCHTWMDSVDDISETVDLAPQSFFGSAGAVNPVFQLILARILVCSGGAWPRAQRDDTILPISASTVPTVPYQAK